ncbi:MAG: hypothetical protein GKR99_09165 [Rhodobacteraceae bacterium]|nr:hypothetical protein [Paracoccaceae bacterium]
MRVAVFAGMILALCGCLPTVEPVSRAPVPPPPGIAPEKLWMNAGGFRVRLNDGSTCHGIRPDELALVADDRPGWSGQLTQCKYLIDYHIVQREFFGLEALGMALSTSNILFGTFKNGPNWNLCLLDVPDEAGEPVKRCAAQAIKGG